MPRKFIFYTHPYARRLLKDTNEFACIALNDYIQDSTRARVRPQLEDVAQWVHDQFLPNERIEVTRATDGRIIAFNLVSCYRSVVRIDMAERLLAEPNRRVVITAVE